MEDYQKSKSFDPFRGVNDTNLVIGVFGPFFAANWRVDPEFEYRPDDFWMSKQREG